MARGFRHATAAAVGIGVLMGMAVVAVRGDAPAVGASGVRDAVAEDNVIVVELSPDEYQSAAERERIQDLAQRHPDKDILLVLTGGAQPLPGEERRRLDEERNERELAERLAAETALRAEGVITDDPASCSFAVADVHGPARFVLCGSVLMALPSRVDPSIASSAADVLDLYMTELVRGTTGDEREAGYWSAFDGSEARTEAAILPGGAVVVDFSSEFVEAMGSNPSGFLVHSLLRQIHATLFQFGEVQSVTLTLDGDCESLGSLLATGCQTVDRDLWALMAEEDGIDFTPAASLTGSSS